MGKYGGQAGSGLALHARWNERAMISVHRTVGVSISCVDDVPLRSACHEATVGGGDERGRDPGDPASITPRIDERGWRSFSRGRLLVAGYDASLRPCVPVFLMACPWRQVGDGSGGRAGGGGN